MAHALQDSRYWTGAIQLCMLLVDKTAEPVDVAFRPTADVRVISLTCSARSLAGLKSCELLRLRAEETDTEGVGIGLAPVVERLQHRSQHLATLGEAIARSTTAAFLLDEA